MMYDQDVKIFWLPLMVLLSFTLDVATSPFEEALHRPRHNTSISRIADLSASKLQGGARPEEMKSRAPIRLRSQAFGPTQPIRKILRLTTDRPPSPEEH
jgi:hypothetical protein